MLERASVTRLDASRKITSVVGALASLVAVWQMVRISRTRRPPLVYPASCSSTLREKCPILRLLFREPRAEPLGAFTSESPSRSSRTGSEVTHTHIMDTGSYSSLRAEMDRVLEFSRTVGLCKYLSSRKGGDSASSASDDAESEQLDTTQQQVVDYDLAMNELSEGQAFTGCTVQGSEDSWAVHGDLPTSKIRSLPHLKIEEVSRLI
ncbi:hypothetical protein BGW80DRAFT_396233 [Lactifluus volemus]|nr:hypothetical protein BGW80DRAFT_396233 [Lactifluus volemus]